jgi:DNA-binding transcriptional LysR family regulator
LSTGPVIVVRKDHPLARQPQVSLRDLAEYPWLIPDYPASHRAIIQRAYLDAGLPPPLAAIDVSTIVFFESLIAQSDLVSVAPSTLLSARAGVDLTALQTDFVFPPEQVGMAFREHSTLLPGARAVIDVFREHCATLPGAIP